MSRFGRYELIRPLGSGGMGRVMEGRMHGPGGFVMPVAIKTLHDGTEGLRREARIGGLLKHDNLVDVYEVGDHEGTWFTAMELCPGGSLVDHIPLPPRAVVQVGLAVCRALAYAHDALGLVHQDLKPENLLLSADGVVKVADLGVALATGFGEEGRIRGTRGYMAPEQASGGQVDARADIHALGVTLLELATGALPEAEHTLDWDQLDDETALDTPTAAAPDWLHEVVERCTAPLPEQRYASMDALAQALAALDVEGPGLREALGIPPADAPARPQGTNLPQPTDRTIGRQDLVEALSDVARGGASIVVVGPPGVGKSRLVLETARTLRARDEWEAWRVDLEAARTEGDVLYALAGVLELSVRRGDPEAVIGRGLAARGPSVWILDHIDRVETIGALVHRLQERAPQVRFLLARGSVLDLPGAHTHNLSPLTNADAMELLVERARRRGAQVADHPDLPELARRLDGLPLALELAAGRLGVLDVNELLERLSLSLLRRGEDQRQGALQAALSGSWDLLGPEEQAALAQLSVCMGGFRLEAAEGVLALNDAPLLETLDRMERASWLQSDGHGRFRLLASVREFASLHLPEPITAQLRHARHFARQGRPDAIARLDVHGGLARRVTLSQDLDNLQHACERAIENGWPDLAIHTLAASWAVVYITGPYSGALALAQRLVAMDGLDPRQEGRAHHLLGDILATCGREPEALPHHEFALAAAEKVDDQSAIARVCASMANCCHHQGKTDDGSALYARALALHQQLGNRREVGVVTGNMALLLDRFMPPAEALELHKRALAIHREVGNRRSEGSALMNLGSLCLRLGKVDEAAAHYDQALAVAKSLRSRSLRALVLGNLGNLYNSKGRHNEALEMYIESIGLHERLGNQRVAAILENGLANAYSALDQNDKALEHFARARAGHQSRGDTLSLTYVATSEGSLLLGMGRTEEARARYEYALAGAVETKNPMIEGVVLGSLGSMEVDAGRLDTAWEHFERAIAVLRTAGVKRYEGQVLTEAARVFLASDPDRAASLLAQSAALLEEVGDLPALSQCRAVNAELHWHLGDLDAARATFDKAVNTGPASGARDRQRLERTRSLIYGT